MKIRVLVNGAAGKMGQITVKTIEADLDFTLVGALGRNDDLAAEIKKTQAQVVIDFTHATAVLQNIETIIDCGACPVIGTTGLVKERIKPLQERCAALKLGGVVAPNFSIGAVLLMKMAQQVVRYFPDVEIVEMHHAGKLDSPSGTAVRTAELLAEAREQRAVERNAPLHETIAGARGADYQGVPIHAVRLPGLVAHEQIIFGGAGETLTLGHDAIDRHCFMPGVVIACKKVVGLQELVYGLEHVL